MLLDFFRLVYPDLCPGCENPLPRGESKICPVCFGELPQTGFHTRPDNPTERIFYGRFPFHAVASAFHFSKGGSVQRILHRIKYKGATELAEQLSGWYGKRLTETGWFETEPLLIPVPLHVKKLYRRGYNQAGHLALGLAASVPGARVSECLRRRDDQGSQTKKGRYARWQNVESLFECTQTDLPSHHHLVLVDDVLTTGATLEACAHALRRSAPENKISALTLAFAGKDA